MRIAFFTDTFHPQINGVTNTLNKLDSYLDKKQIEHAFFAPSYKESNIYEKAHRFKSISFPLYPECRLSLPFYPSLSKMADKFKPDIVHLVTPLGIGVSGLRYANEKGIPKVASYHTNFDSYLKYYRLENFENLLWNYMKWFCNSNSLNFCPSNDTMGVLKSKGINNLRLWSRGVDTDIYNPCFKDMNLRRKLGLYGKIAFLYVGRIAVEKDLDTLTGCIKRISRCYKERCAFVIAGDGPYTPQIRDALGDNAVFTGYLKRKELSSLYASCDAFVFPSGNETFGNVILEAMASGLPVIAANSGGVKDSIVEGYNGIYFRHRDMDDLERAIKYFIENKNIICELGKNARQSALDKSWDNVFDGLLADYHDVLRIAEKIPA